MKNSEHAMTPRPRISVLLPVRNHATCLTQSIQSVVSQSFTDFELVVVDNGSTDESAAIVRNFAATEIRVRIFSEAAPGIVPALNTGLRHCRGAWIARMDADDYMDPLRLEEQLHFMRQNPGLDLTGSCVTAMSAQAKAPIKIREYLKWSNTLLADADIRNSMFIEAPIIHPTFFGRKELFDRLGGYRDNGWAEDYDFLLRAYCAGARFGKTSQSLVHKRYTSDCLSLIDARYKRPAIIRAKAHYWLQWAGERAHHGVAIIGSGAAARSIAQAFTDIGIEVQAFIDHRPSNPNRRIKDVRAYNFFTDSDVWRKRLRNVNYILAVGDADARAAIINELIRCNYQENRDFTRFV